MLKTWPIISTLFTMITLSVLFATRMVGLYSHQVLAFTLFLAFIWGIISRLWWWKKKTLYGRIRKTDRSHLFQAFARSYFWLMLGLTTLIIFPRTSDMITIMAVIAVVWLVVIGIQLLQPLRVNISPTIVMLIGGVVLTFDITQALRPTTEPVVRLSAPFEGEWIVLQGGRSSLQSHHLSAYNQEYALDLVKLENGMIFKEGDGNKSLWCWEATLYAPADGTVVFAKDSMADSEGLNLVSKQADAIGNNVIIQMKDGHYLVFAHLRQGSVVVSEGQLVKTGEVIGKTGNSGNTKMSHLHFQVQTHKELWHPDNRSVPFTFGDGAVHRRNDHITGISNKRK
jgi:hypothetical protein